MYDKHLIRSVESVQNAIAALEPSQKQVAEMYGTRLHTALIKDVMLSEAEGSKTPSQLHLYEEVNKLRHSLLFLKKHDIIDKKGFSIMLRTCDDLIDLLGLRI